MFDLLSGFIQGGAGGISTPSTAYSTFSDRSPINIAPIGVNLGAIMQPYGQGSPENGGYGVDFMNRYTGATGAAYAGLGAQDVTGRSIMPILLIGGAGVLVMLLIKRR